MNTVNNAKHKCISYFIKLHDKVKESRSVLDVLVLENCVY